MDSIILVIDVSKKTFDAALLLDNKIKAKKFNNNLKGFGLLSQWLKLKEIDTVHACMEATGGYEEALAQYLHDNNFKVSVINLAHVKGFAQSKLCRVKTDKADSKLIAQFCQTMKPKLWQPLPLHIQELKQLVNRLDSLIAMKNQETNRLEGSFNLIIDIIQSHIKFLDQQIKEIEILIAGHIRVHQDLLDKSTLLASIPGVGEKTIAVVLAFLPNIEEFESIKQVTAFIGLNPKQRQSGTSVNGGSRISKTGNSVLRKAFYMPAIVSLKFNPVIKAFSERLSSKGKPKMVIVIAAMRKLIHIIYRILKSRSPFSKNIKIM